MTLLHPLALIGLAALAAPILIHLLMRREAVRVPFPTLRFIRATRSASVRRHRLSDWPLLAVRLGLLTIAALALADPVLVVVSRSSASHRTSHAIVVDASGSMDRRGAGGATTLRAIARTMADGRAAAASSSTIVDGESLDQPIAAACEWLGRVPPSRRELTVISDFQRGAFDRSALACVPADARVELVKLDPGAGSASFPGERVVRAGVEAIAVVAPAAAMTDVAYVPTGTLVSIPIEMLGSADERRVAGAAVRAVLDLGVPARASTHRVAFVFAHAAERSDLERRATVITEPWMWDVRQRLERDFPSDARVAAEGGRLIVFVGAEPPPVTTAAMIRAALSAQSNFSYAEHEPGAWSSDDLRTLERPGQDPPADLFRNETSGLGWLLWVAVLAAMAIESWVRRAPRVSREHEDVAHERVA